MLLTFSSSSFYLSLVSSPKFPPELLGCPLNSLPLFLYSLWAKNNPGIQALLFKGTVDLCRGSRKKKIVTLTKTPWTELILSLLHEPFLKNISREAKFETSTQLGSFHITWTHVTKCLTFWCCFICFIKIRVNHMMGL